MTDLAFLDIGLLLIAGCAAGYVGGLLGIGGGTVMIPVLFTLFAKWGVPVEDRMHIAVATSLVVIVLINLSTVRAHHKRGSVDWSIVKAWWPAIALGSITGALLAQSLNGVYLVYIFAILAALLAVKMVLPLDNISLGTQVPGGFKGRVYPFMVGCVSAIMGIGGGALHVPYMVMFGVKIQLAVGTAALAGMVIALSGGFSFLISIPTHEISLSHMVGYVHLPSVLGLAIGSFFFAPLGAATAHRLSKRGLSIIFGLFLLTATARLLAGVL